MCLALSDLKIARPYAEELTDMIPDLFPLFLAAWHLHGSSDKCGSIVDGNCGISSVCVSNLGT